MNGSKTPFIMKAMCLIGRLTEVENQGVITLGFLRSRSSPLASVIKRQRDMIEPKDDFSKVYLTNGLKATNDHQGHRRPALTALVLVIAMGITWYVIS